MKKPEYVGGKNELIDIIANNYDKKIVFMFTASWCGPCKKVKSVIENKEWIEKYDNIKIIYIDIDDPKNEDILNDFDIASVPTFIVNEMQNDKLIKLQTFSGADIKKLEELIK
jgi:thioredoxin 1